MHILILGIAWSEFVVAPAVAAWTGSSLCNIHHVVGGEKWCGGLMEFFLSSVDLYNVSRKEIKRKNVELKDESKFLFIILGLIGHLSLSGIPTGSLHGKRRVEKQAECSSSSELPYEPESSALSSSPELAYEPGFSSPTSSIGKQIPNSQKSLTMFLWSFWGISFHASESLSGVKKPCSIKSFLNEIRVQSWFDNHCGSSTTRSGPS